MKVLCTIVGVTHLEGKDGRTKLTLAPDDGVTTGVLQLNTSDKAAKAFTEGQRITVELAAPKAS